MLQEVAIDASTVSLQEYKLLFIFNILLGHTSEQNPYGTLSKRLLDFWPVTV